jgi:glycosyltransferase involved in cell wall biosynthesis
MKIAYVAQLEADRETGVNKKIIDQVTAWERSGHQARLFALSPSSERWGGWQGVPIEIESYASAPRGVMASQRLARAVRDFSPDIVYYRMGVCYPGFQTLARTRPTVVEVNSDNEREARVRMGFVKYRIFLAAGRRLLKRAIGAVSVSQSVGEALRAQGMEVLVLGNSIDMSRVRAAPPPANPAPRLIFLGSLGCVWHGVDKLKAAAVRFPHWTFDVVGLTPADVSGPLPQNVVFHGFLPASKYERLLSAADVALGTLALHRKGMKDTTSLKVREYLAAGLPVISGHPDPDFTTEVPYLLELPNSESNVSANLDRIEHFVLRWRGLRVQRSDVLHLDISAKERQRLAFFNERLAAVGGPRKASR